MRHFEVLGLPGAGKTTLARGLPRELGVMRCRGFVERERFRERGLRGHQMAIRLLPRALKLRLLAAPSPDATDAAWFVLRNRAFHEAAMDVYGEMEDAEKREVGFRLLYETYSHYGFVNRVARPGDGFLPDEGIWQLLTYALAHTGSAAETFLGELLMHAPPLNGLIVLELPLGVALERVQARAKRSVHTRAQDFTETTIMAAMESLIRPITDSLRAAGVAVIVVRADRPPEQLLAEVAAFLADHMVA